MSDDHITQDDKKKDDKVVSLHRFSDGRGQTPLRQVEAYWSALRNGATVPRRSQIDPRGLENILEYAFILERIAPGVARIRLAGQHLNQLAGMEARGMPLTTFFTPSGRIHVSAALEHVFDAPAVVELMLQGKPKFGRPKPEARMILLPLQDETGKINRALGVLVANDVKAHSGLHLSVIDTDLRPVSGFRHSETPKAVAGFAETQYPILRPASHLRLV
ncbi:MAG: PAS domain-containing protein [Rhodobacteraceae bacterium]|nr:PAS domain-containing protein [Paracoccaceae bacterium]